MTDHTRPRSCDPPRATVPRIALPAGWSWDDEHEAKWAKLDPTHPNYGALAVRCETMPAGSVLSVRDGESVLDVIAGFEEAYPELAPPKIVTRPASFGTDSPAAAPAPTSPRPHPALLHPHYPNMLVRYAYAEWADVCATCVIGDPDDLCGWFHRCSHFDCREWFGERFLTVGVSWSVADEYRGELAESAYCSVACFTRDVLDYLGVRDGENLVAGNPFAMAAVLELVREKSSERVRIRAPKAEELA